jgi:hypothetical protein
MAPSPASTRPPPGVRLSAVSLLDDADLPLVIAGDTRGAIVHWDLHR